MMEFWLLIFLLLRIFLHCVAIRFSFFLCSFSRSSLCLPSRSGLWSLLSMHYYVCVCALAILSLIFFPFALRWVRSRSYCRRFIFSFIHSIHPSAVSGYCWWMLATVLLFAAPRSLLEPSSFLSCSLVLAVTPSLRFIWISNQSTARLNVCYAFFVSFLSLHIWFGFVLFGMLAVLCVCLVCLPVLRTHTHSCAIQWHCRCCKARQKLITRLN